MFLFKNEECSSYLHDLIVSVMEQWPGNKEQSLWLRFPWGAVKGISGPAWDVRYWLMWPTVCHRPTHPETLDRPGHQDNGPGIGNPALTGVKCRLGLTQAPVTLLIKIAPIWYPQAKLYLGLSLEPKQCVITVENVLWEIELLWSLNFYLEPAFIRIQFNSSSNFQFW